MPSFQPVRRSRSAIPAVYPFSLICLGSILTLLSCSLKDSTPEKAVLNREAVAISYQTCGEADTTLLFIHGWCINQSYWDEQVKYFCPKYRVVTLDLPGFGASGKNRTNWSFDEYVADIKYLIDTLHLKNTVLIGHSMSGDILLKADNLFPQSLIGIIGIDNLHEPGSLMSEEERKQTNEYFDLMASKFDSTVRASMLVSLFQPTTDTTIVKRVMKDVFDSDSTIATNVLRSLVDVAQQEKPLMQGLQHRLYLINSSVQPINRDSLTKYCAKGFEMINLGPTGHYPMVERPYEFNQAIGFVMKRIGAKK